jgi:hypothetical protein
MEFQDLMRCEKRPAKWPDSAPFPTPDSASVGWAKSLPCDRRVGTARARFCPRGNERVRALCPPYCADAARALAPQAERSGERAQDSTNNLVRVRGATSCPSPNPLPAPLRHSASKTRVNALMAGRGSTPNLPHVPRRLAGCAAPAGYLRLTSPGKTSNTSELASISAKTAASAPVIQACAPSASSSA